MAQPGNIIGFGFSSCDVKPDLSDHDQTLGRFEACGASHCELNLARYELVIDQRLATHKVRDLRRICSARRLEYTVHSALAVNFMDVANIALHKNVCRAMVQLAGEVGAGILVHHPGVVAMELQDQLDERHAREREALHEMGELAKSLGVKIGVETLFVESHDKYTPDPSRLAHEIEAIGHSHVVGTLDISHAYIQSTHRGLDFRAELRRFATVANHVHIHDSFGRPAHMKGRTPGEDIAYGLGDLHLPPGWGGIPWEEIMPELVFLPGTVLNVEMRARHYYALLEIADFMRRLVEMTGTRPAPKNDKRDILI